MRTRRWGDDVSWKLGQLSVPFSIFIGSVLLRHAPFLPDSVHERTRRPPAKLSHHAPEVNASRASPGWARPCEGRSAKGVRS